MPNQFCWYELMTSDVPAAQAFYGAVVGWTAESSRGPETGYTILSVQDRGVAGILHKPETRETGAVWLGYVAVDECDDAAAAIEKGGGAIHKPPSDIPDVVRFAVVADPQGAVFYVMKPFSTEAPPALPMDTPGVPVWHELYAADWKAALDFYSRQFGWTPSEAMDMGEMGTYQLFAAGGEAIGGMMNKPEDFPRPFWLFYFAVEEIDAAVERVKANGGEIMHGPSEVPGEAWIIQARDPQGAMFALVGPRR